MERQKIEPQPRAQHGQYEQSALSYLEGCTAFFHEAKIQKTTLGANPDVQTLFAALKLRFLRFSSCKPFSDGLVSSNPRFQPIQTIMTLIAWSQEDPAGSDGISEMQVPEAYAQTPDPQTRRRLHNTLTNMGNVHKSATGFTDSVTDRTKPVIKNISQITKILSPMKVLEDDPEVRSKLQSQCAEELKQVKDEEDLNLLDGIVEDDEILREQIKKIRGRNSHIYIDNTVEVEATAAYGDFISSEGLGIQRGGSHYYARNKATGRAQAHYGDAYGQAIFSMK